MQCWKHPNPPKTSTISASDHLLRVQCRVPFAGQHTYTEKLAPQSQFSLGSAGLTAGDGSANESIRNLKVIIIIFAKRFLPANSNSSSSGSVFKRVRFSRVTVTSPAACPSLPRPSQKPSSKSRNPKLRSLNYLIKANILGGKIWNGYTCMCVCVCMGDGRDGAAHSGRGSGEARLDVCRNGAVVRESPFCFAIGPSVQRKRIHDRTRKRCPSAHGEKTPATTPRLSLSISVVLPEQ